jgi:hypothetical protein
MLLPLRFITPGWQLAAVTWLARAVVSATALLPHYRLARFVLVTALFIHNAVWSPWDPLPWRFSLHFRQKAVTGDLLLNHILVVA